MVRVYRAIQQWNHWLTQPLGKKFLEAEQQYLPALLQRRTGKQVLLIGVPHQHGLLKSSPMFCHFLLSPLVHKNDSVSYIESELDELPILSGSIDLVLLPHALEHVDNSQQLLAEACRVVKPEGHIIILGFNPMSLWGLKKILTKEKHTPWSGSFIRASVVKKWLALADFELIKQETFLFRPPLHHLKLYQKLKLMEWIGKKLRMPWGGVYALTAKAKVIPLTPIKWRWQQKLSSVHVTIPRPTTRNSP